MHIPRNGGVLRKIAAVGPVSRPVGGTEFNAGIGSGTELLDIIVCRQVRL